MQLRKERYALTVLCIPETVRVAARLTTAYPVSIGGIGVNNEEVKGDERKYGGYNEDNGAYG